MGEGGSVRERRRIPRNLSLLYVFVFPPSINGDVKAPNRKVFRFIELLTRFLKKKKKSETDVHTEGGSGECDGGGGSFRNGHT